MDDVQLVVDSGDSGERFNEVSEVMGDPKLMNS